VRCDGETAQVRHMADTGHRHYQLLLNLMRQTVADA
jgi:hypothetical protein